MLKDFFFCFAWLPFQDKWFKWVMSEASSSTLLEKDSDCFLASYLAYRSLIFIDVLVRYDSKSRSKSASQGYRVNIGITVQSVYGTSNCRDCISKIVSAKTADTWLVFTLGFQGT